jgi:ankyrin repeat protein
MRDLENHSLLDVAIVKKHANAINTLLPYDFMPLPEDKRSVLETAAKTGDATIVQLIYDNIGVPTSYIIDAAFLASCTHGHTDVVKYFLSKRTSVFFDIDTPMMQACQHGQVIVTDYLIAAGCDIHFRFGFEVIRTVIASPLPRDRMSPMLEFLLSTGCVMMHGGTPAWRDVGRGGCFALINYFLGRAPHDERRVCAALTGACREGHVDVVAHLLEVVDKHRYNWEPVMLLSFSSTNTSLSLVPSLTAMTLYQNLPS